MHVAHYLIHHKKLICRNLKGHGNKDTEIYSGSPIFAGEKYPLFL